VLGDERLELSDQVGVAAEREVGLDPFLNRCQTELVEAHRLLPDDSVVFEVRKEWPPPELEGLPELRRSG
jgi:hypothetical protein